MAPAVSDFKNPILNDSLHWLPVVERITFKLLVFVHKIVHGLPVPGYLKNIIILNNQETYENSITAKLMSGNTKTPSEIEQIQ